MVSFWNQYKQAGNSFLLNQPDKLNYTKARYARQLCEGLCGADILDVGCVILMTMYFINAPMFRVTNKPHRFT